MHCNSKRDDEEELEEMHCNSKRDDEEELEEAAKPDFLDLDGDGDKKEPMKKAAKDKEDKEDEEQLEELQLGGEPKMTGDAKGMTPEQIRMAKAKEKAKKAREDAKKKGLGPVVDES